MSDSTFEAPPIQERTIPRIKPTSPPSSSSTSDAPSTIDSPQTALASVRGQLATERTRRNIYKGYQGGTTDNRNLTFYLVQFNIRVANIATLHKPQLEQLLSSLNRDSRADLAKVADFLLGKAEHQLGENRRLELKKKKNAILTRLKEAHKKDADITFGSSSLQIRRK